MVEFTPKDQPALGVTTTSSNRFSRMHFHLPLVISLSIPGTNRDMCPLASACFSGVVESRKSRIERTNETVNKLFGFGLELPLHRIDFTEPRSTALARLLCHLLPSPDHGSRGKL